MSWLSRGLKKVGRVITRNKGALLDIATGGLSHRVLTAAKALGIGPHKQTVAKPQGAAVSAALTKMNAMAPVAVRDVISKTRVSAAPSLYLAKPRKAKVPRAPRAASGKQSAQRSKMKAAAAAWRAAGKPGRWIDYWKAVSKASA